MAASIGPSFEQAGGPINILTALDAWNFPKYVGFVAFWSGSQGTLHPPFVAPPPLPSSFCRPPPLQMFSKGLSSLGSLAGSAAHAAKERAAQAHLDQAAAQAAEKAKEVGTKGWSLLKSAYATAAGAVEQAAAQVGHEGGGLQLPAVHVTGWVDGMGAALQVESAKAQEMRTDLPSCPCLPPPHRTATKLTWAARRWPPLVGAAVAATARSQAGPQATSLLARVRETTGGAPVAQVLAAAAAAGCGAVGGGHGEADPAAGTGSGAAGGGHGRADRAGSGAAGGGHGGADPAGTAGSGAAGAAGAGPAAVVGGGGAAGVGGADRAAAC